MSNSQEQMKDIINNLRAGKTDKEVFCKEIQKDVYCLVYPVFGEDYKKVSTRAIIDICTKIDTINVDKNIMRQIATMVSVFMFSLIDSSTINVNDNYEYNFYKIKEDRELFNIIKDCSKIFKNMKAYDSASDNIKSLSRVQTIMMELYGYEMHSVEEIQELLGLDSEYILKIIAMMKETILGSKPKGYVAGAISGEDDKVELDAYAYEGLDSQEADEESLYYEETDDNNDIESEALGKADSEETDENDEGVSFEYDEIGYVRDDYEDSYSGKYTLMDRMSEMVGRIFPHVSRNSRRKVVYASLVMALIVVLLAASVFAMAGNRKKKVKKTVDWTPIEYTTRVPKETTTSKEKTSVAETTQSTTQGNTESTTQRTTQSTTEKTKTEETTPGETKPEETTPEETTPEETKPEETTPEETTPEETTPEETTPEETTPEETTPEETTPEEDDTGGRRRHSGFSR
ncbi:MAG: hypothetical protein PUB04_07165 [Clostridia bacterium]|nr:hypothetical protein [Clostridia bacterium]